MSGSVRKWLEYIANTVILFTSIVVGFTVVVLVSAALAWVVYGLRFLFPDA